MVEIKRKKKEKTSYVDFQTKFNPGTMSYEPHLKKKISRRPLPKKVKIAFWLIILIIIILFLLLGILVLSNLS